MKPNPLRLDRRAFNPLRVDPTRTTMLRRRFQIVLRGRFSRVRRRLIDLVDREDAFGLRERLASVFNLDRPISEIMDDLKNNQRWRFHTDPEKVREFEEWLRTQFRGEILGPDEEALWRAYVEEGYRRGAERAFDDSRRGLRFAPGAGDFFEGSKREFLRSAFGRAVSVDRLKLLVGRTLTDLRGVTEATATAMSRGLADGLVRGLSPREIARDLVKSLDGVGLNRALTIARTEIVRAHAEGQLDGFETLGVDEIGVAAEWSSVADACPMCAPLDGVVMKVSEARGLLPRHPNCRCAWIPANVGEDKRGQKRSRREILSAVGKSVKEETGERTVREAKDESRWAGADVDPSRQRPRDATGKN